MVRETFSVGLLGALGVSALACGRIGYGPLDLAPDTGGAPDVAAHRDATASSSGGTSADAGEDAGSAVDATVDAGSDGAIADAGVVTDSGSSADAATDAGAAQETGAAPDAGGDAAADAPPDAGYPYPSCAAVRVWSVVFDSDPTQLSWGADGGPEWVVRSGGAFPASELDGGVWTSTTGATLDTRPLDPFSSRALVDVRMRSLAVSPGQHGAVVWINMNESAPQFSALFAALGIDPDGGQTLSVWGKPGGVETALATFPGLPEAFVDVHLDVDPVAATVGVWVDGVQEGTYPLPLTGVPNGDAFATVLSWNGTSAFQSVEIQDCVP